MGVTINHTKMQSHTVFIAILIIKIYFFPLRTNDCTKLYVFKREQNKLTQGKNDAYTYIYYY